MQHDAFIALLNDVAKKSKTSEVFDFLDQQEATVFVEAGSGMLTVDRIRRVGVGAAATGNTVTVDTVKGDRYFFEVARIAAVRVRGGTESAGFV